MAGGFVGQAIGTGPNIKIGVNGNQRYRRGSQFHKKTPFKEKKLLTNQV
jgi:hypothetical protein